MECSLLQYGDNETLEGICDLNDMFTAESGTYSKMEVSRDKFREHIRQFDGIKAFCVVFKVEGKVVGYSPAWLDTVVHDKINFEISTFYVHPDYRNSGIGGMMLDKLVELMDNCDARFGQIGICAEFDDGGLLQRATELLFKRKGFRQIGTIYAREGK